jgi:hypothetical protein
MFYGIIVLKQDAPGKISMSMEVGTPNTVFPLGETPREHWHIKDPKRENSKMAARGRKQKASLL